MEATVWLIWIGPSGHEKTDEYGQTVQLVPGQRYQMSHELAEENLKPNNATHWKRPEPKMSAVRKD